MQLDLDSGFEADDFDGLAQPGAGSLATSDGDVQGFLNADSRANTTVGGKASLTIDQAGFRLIGGEAGWGTLGAAYNVTYAFRSTAPATLPKDVTEFQRFNAAQINQTELALKAWADVANITFTRVGAGYGGEDAYSNQASMLFSNYTSGVAGAVAFSAYPGNPNFNATSGDVWVNVSISYNANPSAANYGGQTLTHEIGHAIGLSHPGDYNAASDDSKDTITYAANAGYYEDSRQYTVMSYFNESNTGANFRGLYASSPMLDDIAAAQQEYGANMSTRTGDTVYGFNSNADQPWLKATSSNSPLVMAVWDAGGRDTFDFSGYASAQVIDLRAGFFSSVGGLTGNVAIAQGVQIENARGGSGADIIHGNAGDNEILGGAGNDSIDGGLSGSNYLRGEDGNDSLTGGSGFDDINGNRGDDTARGGGGGDWVVGGQDQDLLYGDDGDDVVYGNLGNDTLFGGDGADWVRGGQGDDLVDGGAGDDLLWGDRGNDTVTGGGGADMFHIFVGAGIDRVTDFNGAEGDRVVIDEGASWTVSQSAVGVVIALADGSTMVLAGVAPSSLQAGWILPG